MTTTTDHFPFCAGERDPHCNCSDVEAELAADEAAEPTPPRRTASWAR